MPLTWFSKSEQPIIATINANHITLNAPSISLFETIDSVRLGYDTSKSIIAIELLTRDQIEFCRYQEDELISFHAQSSYVRINCTAFIDLLLETIDSLKLKVLPIKLSSYFDNNKKCIIVELNKEVE